MKNKLLLKLSILFMFLGLCTGCNNSSKVEINSLEDLKKYDLNLISPSDYDVSKELDELCNNYTLNYINDVQLGIDAVSNGKYDGFVCGINLFEEAEAAGTLGQTKVIEEPIKTYYVGLGLCETTPIQNYKSKVDTFINQCMNDGTIDDMNKRWFVDSNYTMPEIKTPENPIYTLKAVTWGGTKPYSFLADNKLVGFDVELVYRLASYLNCAITLEHTEYPSMLLGLSTGKYDVISANLYISEERAENIIYSEPYSQIDINLLVKDYSKTKEKSNLIEDLKDGFNKTFIEDNRWKTIASGLGITLLITFFGFILGNVFGAIFCALSMSKHKGLRIIEDIYTRIMQGTPIVVILMILFYIIFGKSSINGVYIAILGFGLTSGSSLAMQFKGVITGVPKEQKEAGLALGLTPLQTFTGIVCPQAIRKILPGYFAEIIAVLKGTSIVGYVAVTDLTKAGDLIRTATFEAFFSIFSVAVIYFLISFLLISILKFIQKKLLPKRVQIQNNEGGK